MRWANSPVRILLTLESCFTEYDSMGEIVSVSTYTRYASANGDWRVVGRFGGDELATLYRRGRGVYQSNSRTSRIIKQTDHAPGCPLRTGEDLLADPKFTRTEEILGFTAYVLIDRRSEHLLIEHYFVPEPGGAFQASNDVQKWSIVSEPISVTLGEPDRFNVTGPDYMAIEEAPIFIRNIGEHLLSKPDADYPAEALAQGLSGFVNVTVIVDKTGSVISAGAMAGSAPQALREAAVEAAYKASFKPIIVEGRAVVAKGIIDYRFVLPK